MTFLSGVADCLPGILCFSSISSDDQSHLKIEGRAQATAALMNFLKEAQGIEGARQVELVKMQQEKEETFFTLDVAMS